MEEKQEIQKPIVFLKHSSFLFIRTAIQHHGAKSFILMWRECGQHYYKRSMKNLISSEFWYISFFRLTNNMNQSTLKTQEKQGVTIFPKRENVFNALKYCSFENIKVSFLSFLLRFLGHYLGSRPLSRRWTSMERKNQQIVQAHGLSFSVPKGILIPPSLRNIFKEISTDMNIPVNTCTDLTCWAKQVCDSDS